MLLILGVVVVGVVGVLGAEVLDARRGPRLDEFDVAQLNATYAAPDGTTEPRRLRVVWLGDSTAAGVGASSPDRAVSAGVARRVASEGAEVDVRVIAVSGAEVADVVKAQVAQVDALDPDVVVISVGANDTVHLTSVSSFRRSYRRLLDALEGAGVPARRIVLVGVPDMGSPTRLRQPLRAVVGWRGRRLDDEVGKLAGERGAHYVDLFAATSSAFRADPGRYFAVDEYHPSDAGYARWAEAIAPAVTAASAAR